MTIKKNIGENNMKKINSKKDAKDFFRQVICSIFEKNINRYKENKELKSLEYVTCWFVYYDGMLTDEYIDKIYPNLISKDMIDNNAIEFKDDGTIKIKDLNKIEYKLWESVINSDEYINFINKQNILESGVFDNKYNREYRANDGEHFLAVLSALEDANVDKSKYDNYIKENLYIYGKNVYNKNYESTNILKEIKLLSKEKRIKPVDKKKLVNDYQKNHWIEK